MLMQRMGREPTLRGMKDFITAYNGNPDHPVLHDFVVHMRRYASDTASYDDFVRQWFDTVVVPEYRVHDAKTVAAPGGGWITTAEVENAGTGRMPIDVAAIRGERFPSDSTKKGKKAEPYAAEMTPLTLGAKENRPSPFGRRSSPRSSSSIRTCGCSNFAGSRRRRNSRLEGRWRAVAIRRPVRARGAPRR